MTGALALLELLDRDFGRDGQQTVRLAWRVIKSNEKKLRR